MHQEQVGEHQEGESHPMTEARMQGSSVCHSQIKSESVDGDSERCTGKRGLQAKLRAQSSEPKTKAMVQMQKKTLPQENRAPLLLHAVDAGRLQGWQLPFLIAISSLSTQNQCLETQCAQSFKEMKDHKNPSDVLMRTLRYKYINGADNRGRRS